MSTSHVTRVAAYGLVADKDHLLLCRIAGDLPHAGMWTLPGGGLEFGEHPEVGMVREVEEETGLIVSPIGLAGIDSIVGEVPEHSFHSIRIIYHTELIGGVLRNETDGSTDLCQWHPIDGLGKLGIVDLVEAALPMIVGGRT